MSYGIAAAVALSLTFPIVNFDARSARNEWPSYIFRAHRGLAYGEPTSDTVSTVNPIKGRPALGHNSVVV